MRYQKFTLSALAAALSVSAFAADTQELEAVQVKAPAGSMFKLGEVPFRQAKSAVAISAETLREEGVSKTDELGRYQAGFTNQPFGNDTNTNWFRIRGAEASQAVDGRPTFSYGFFTPYTETYGIQAVEVVKGADAMTFGAGQPGGLINYISKRADQEQAGKGEVRLHGGNMGQYGIAGDYTFALADNVRNRAVASLRNTKGEWRGTKNRTLYLANALQWDITDATRLDVLASYQRDSGVPSSNFLTQEGTLVASPAGKIDRRNNYGDPVNDTETNRQFSFGYDLNHRFNQDLAFSSSYRYSNADNFHRGAYLYPAAYSATWAAIPPSEAGYTVSRGVVYNSGKAKSHSLDNHVTWKFKNDWLDNTLVGGIDYRYQNVDSMYTLFGSTSAANILNPNAGHGQAQDLSAAAPYYVKTKQLGFYLQDRARFAKKFVATLGIRHDRAQNQAQNSVFGENFSRERTLKKDHTSYAASFMYQAPYGLNPYISYSEAFNLPAGLSGTGVLYDPQITKQTEIGLKYLPSWLDGSVSVAAFTAKDKGALQSQDLGVSVSNPNLVRRRGVEIQADANITENVSAGLAYTYLKSVTEQSSGDIRNPLIPRQSLSAKAQYRFTNGALNGLTLGGGLRYVGTSVTQNGSLYSGMKVPSSTVVDLMALYNFAPNWQAQLNVDNVGNRRYVSGCDYYCYYGAGRNINASVSYKF